MNVCLSGDKCTAATKGEPETRLHRRPPGQSGDLRSSTGPGQRGNQSHKQQRYEKLVTARMEWTLAPWQPLLLHTGFNPVWDETLNFVIHTPDLALVRFVVEDYDKASRNDFIGQFTLPFTCIQPGGGFIYSIYFRTTACVWPQTLFCASGYRHIHLLSKDGTAIPPSSLFVKISISDLTWKGPVLRTWTSPTSVLNRPVYTCPPPVGCHIHRFLPTTTWKQEIDLNMYVWRCLVQFYRIKTC